MKAFCLSTLFMLFAAGGTIAQKQSKSLNLQEDKVDYQGYSIKLLPGQGPGFGYAIFKNKELLVQQTYNPFNMSPIGLSKKEDAIKLAQWQVRQLKLGEAGNIPSQAANSARFADGKVVAASPNARQSEAAVPGKPFFNQPLPKSVARELQIHTNN
jgi:hypothetical protein